MLMKLLANRNAIIESYKALLEKCQSNFQTLRKQNSELILTNGQMMKELSSSRQRKRELQHELGGKNGILKAMKLELMAKEHTAKLKHVIDANELLHLLVLNKLNPEKRLTTGAASFSGRSEREGESALRCRARLERHHRTAERVAKALAEKNMRDLLVQKEQAERNRLAETLDTEIRRWSSGKQGN